MSQPPSKTDFGSEVTSVLRPWGVSFSFAANAILGVYYLVYPLLRDVTLYPIFALGTLSLLASYGLFRMTKWGVWLGAALYPAQIVAPVFAFLATVVSLYALLSVHSGQAQELQVTISFSIFPTVLLTLVAVPSVTPPC